MIDQRIVQVIQIGRAELSLNASGLVVKIAIDVPELREMDPAEADALLAQLQADVNRMYQARMNARLN